MQNVSSRRVVAGLTLVLALTPVACSDDDSTGPEVYSEPFSVEITSEFGNVISTATRALTSSPIFLQSGGSEVVEFVFLNEAGNLITPLSGEFVEIQITNEAIGTWTPDQPGGFTGTLRGLAPGTTELVVRYMYGGVNSSDAKASFVSATFEFTTQ